LANSKGIKAPFFKKSEIQGEVDAFCAKYKIDQQQVPLDVELIVEADLRLELRPESNLFKKTEMDALLTSNRKTIMVDLDRFTRKNLQNRLRFTIAHEIGHYVLHEATYKDVIFGSVDDWLDFFEDFPQIEYRKLEWHCDEFAGRLLIHRDLLRKKFEETRAKLKGTEWEKVDPLPVYVVEAMATEIAKFFGVSEQPVIIRLESEGIWVPNGT
jgi:hypothetical protein